MNILIVGKGWTGNKMATELRSRNHQVIQCSHKEVVNYLNEFKVDWVVNCAGVTGTPNVDACELDKFNTLEGNALFPIRLQQQAERANARFAHFSSGCIYQGTIDSEYAQPNFFGSTYSISKGISDSYLRDIAMVFRIRMPFTGVIESKNYLSKILKYATSGKLIEGGPNSLTDLDEAVSVAADLITANEKNGPYNLVNSGSVTMLQLTKIMGIFPVWFTPEEFKQVTLAERSNCVIPAYKAMSPVYDALKKATSTLLNPSPWT